MTDPMIRTGAEYFDLNSRLNRRASLLCRLSLGRG